MHSHYGLQEQLLMTAPLIIRDHSGSRDEQDVVILLNDFSFTPPEEIFAALRKNSAPRTRIGHTGMSSMKADDNSSNPHHAMAMPSGRRSRT
jgi:hypothetical protein